ncbi:Hypothetical predicted protein [Lynx pardinus]|uniref:Uncharacterized protein n=1 Tax=Lynx pardinus TaxID=191816 RepID=A0A485NVP2_LYNPA|nr:Hypothetical predicted protein [Lynx pardinus]
MAALGAPVCQGGRQTDAGPRHLPVTGTEPSWRLAPREATPEWEVGRPPGRGGRTTQPGPHVGPGAGRSRPRLSGSFRREKREGPGRVGGGAEHASGRGRRAHVSGRGWRDAHVGRRVGVPGRRATQLRCSRGHGVPGS